MRAAVRNTQAWMRLTLAAAYAARSLRMPLIVEMISALRQHLVQRPKHMPNRLQSGRQCPEKRKMFEMKNVEAYELMNLWLAQKNETKPTGLATKHHIENRGLRVI